MSDGMDGKDNNVADAAALERIIKGRWSCRAFRPEPVADATLTAILTLAQHTASWNNVQPWHVTITRGAATERFRRMMVARVIAGAAPEPDFSFPREYREPYQARRRACGFQLYDAVGIARGDKEAYQRQSLRNFEFFDAPHVSLIDTDEALGPYGAVDCGAYVTQFMLAARAHGVATIAQAALALHSGAIRAHFAMPDTWRIVCGISFGYADPAHPINGYRTPRAAIDEAVRFVDV